MKAHIIENSIVINTIEVESLDFLPNLVDATEGSIGWHYDGQTFTPPPRWQDVETGKAELRESINAKRDELESAGFPYLGKWLDSDQISVQRIAVTVQAAQAALAANQPFSIEWTCADNSVLPLDAQGVIGMPVALSTHANALHQHARELKALVDAAESESDIAGIDTVNGWPLGSV